VRRPSSLPEFATAAEFEAWLPQVRGKFVASRSRSRPAGRAHYGRSSAAPGALERMQQRAQRGRAAWNACGAQRVAAQAERRELRLRLEQAGAAGILESYWSNDLGVNKIFGTNTSAPDVDLSCEDYGLVYRLAAERPGPACRVNASRRVPGRGAGLQHHRRDPRQRAARTSTSCCRRTSTRGTARPAPPTTAPAR
jgi:carboxypeptidase Q